MNVAALASSITNRGLARFGWALLLIGAVFAAGNAVLFMTVDSHGHPGIKERFFATVIAGWAHTMGGAVAVLIGPFQMLAAIRLHAPRVHVWMGRIYLTAVAAGALGGLYFAPTSVAGWTGTLGFSTLALFWLYSGTKAFVAIRRRDIAEHRRWMIRNYALTFAAATLRVELPLLMFSGLTFTTAFQIVAWSSWVPNWLVVEAWLRRDTFR